MKKVVGLIIAAMLLCSCSQEAYKNIKKLDDGSFSFEVDDKNTSFSIQKEDGEVDYSVLNSNGDKIKCREKDKGKYIVVTPEEMVEETTYVFVVTKGSFLNKEIKGATEITYTVNNTENKKDNTNKDDNKNTGGKIEASSDAVKKALSIVDYGKDYFSPYVLLEKSTKVSELDDTLKARIIFSAMYNDLGKSTILVKDNEWDEGALKFSGKIFDEYYEEYFGSVPFNKKEEYSHYLTPICGSYNLNYNGTDWIGECYGIGDSGYPEKESYEKVDSSYIKDNKLYIVLKVIGIKTFLTDNEDQFWQDLEGFQLYSDLSFKTKISDVLTDGYDDTKVYDTYIDKGSKVTYVFDVLKDNKYRFVETIVG